MNGETRRVMFSSASGAWRTPSEVFEALDREFHFTLDVCADPDHPLRGDLRSFTGKQGLDVCWGPHETCYMNPPYGRGIMAPWLEKAADEVTVHHGVQVVALLPARTDPAWFWDWCVNREIRLIRGRLKFSGAEHGAPFPSMIVVFRPKEPVIISPEVGTRSALDHSAILGS